MLRFRVNYKLGCLIVILKYKFNKIGLIIKFELIMNPSYGNNSRDYRQPPQQFPQNTQQIMLNNNIQNSNLIRTSKQSQRKRRSLIPIIMAVLYVKKIKKSIKKKKHREKILEEWYNTEYSYNLDLNIAVKLIKKPMVQNQIITVDQAQILFPEFEGMIELSNMMLETISKARKTANPNKIFIGKELNKFANGYKLYGGYFGSHGRSSKLLAQLAQKHEPQMKQIQANMQAQLAKKNSKKETMTIKDCMQQPLYRLFKYVLLLKQYLKKLPKYHPDYDAVTQCHHSFHQINNFNNDLMKKLEDQQKKVKLDALFGQALRQNRVLIAEMQASTIYFDSKLYIFNDIVIITKVHTILGAEKQEKFGNLQLSEFSYVAEQQNMKYFKNILILISKQQCIHLFFPDQGSRAELFKCLQKIIRDLRIKFYERRKIGEKNLKAKKITFTLQQEQMQKEKRNFLLEPQFKIQILGIQVRPLSSLTNDTVYVTRFMIPYYYQDQINFLEAEGIPQRRQSSNQSADNRSSTNSSKQDKRPHLQRFNSLPFGEQYSEPSDKNLRQNIYKCINQRVQVHFSVLQQMYKEMKATVQDRLPDIDPITKDVNIYAKGKRKTKAFQMRKFFIEEFFNFIFRHPIIMSNPLWFISKLRINQDIWNYSTQRNSQMKKMQKQEEVSYGYNHCGICKRGKINSVEEYQHYRNYYNSKPSHRANKQADKYCFNFFNLLRMRMLSFNYICFNNSERILTFYHLLQGRLDYPFLIHRSIEKSVKLIKVYLPSVDDNFVSVMIDTKSTVGEVIDELGNMFKMRSVFDFDLMATYTGKNRLLDRDEFLVDVIKSLDIQFQEVSADKKQINKPESKPGLFDSIKRWGKQMFQESDQKNKIFFIKTTYLHRSLQMKSFLANPQKKLLQIQKIFWSIKKGLIKLTDKQFIEVASLFYCLKELDVIQHFSYLKMSNKQIQRLIPDQHHHTFQYQQQFRKQIALAVQKQKNILMGYNKNTSYIHSKIIELVTQKIDYMTYYIDVEAKQIPQVYLDKKIMPAICLLGVNYKQIIITRNQVNTSPLVALPLDEIDYSLSVFSIFITHQSCNFRFDSKMLHHFGQMLKKYQVICKKFPQHMAS